MSKTGFPVSCDGSSAPRSLQKAGLASVIRSSTCTYSASGEYVTSNDLGLQTDGIWCFLSEFDRLM